MLLLFDIDNTLLDTKAFAWAAFERVREMAGLSIVDFVSLKDQYYSSLEVSTDFDPTAFVDFLIAKQGTSRDKSSREQSPQWRQPALDIFLDSDFIRSFLYKDVTRNLQRLKTDNSLGIFSQGQKNYQLKKIENSGIIRFFDQNNIYIFSRKEKPEVIRALPRPSIVIDDKKSVTDIINGINAKKSGDSGITAIWLQRSGQGTQTEGKEQAKPSRQDGQIEQTNQSTAQVISSLDELL
jgi:phosphoglycolate phosphatase-like HAD superfamily hydrolase